MLILSKRLAHIKRGIEKEALRVTTDGLLAQNPHPYNLGSALTHPHITTDYSESLLEFSTPAVESIDDTLDFLQQLHRYTATELTAQNIWPARLCRVRFKVMIVCLLLNMVARCNNTNEAHLSSWVPYALRAYYAKYCGYSF